MPKPSDILYRVVLLAACLCTLAAGSARAQITVALTPATQTVPPGTDFDVFVDVSAAGSAFNAFDIVVVYDPAALTLLPTAPTSLQQGCLMTGGCSAACGNTFHRFSAAADSIAVSDILLCNQVSLTGPGHLYKLRFRASVTAQLTALTVRSVQFYNAGLLVGPVSSTGARVGIGVSVGVEPRPAAGMRVLRAEPNPARGRVQFVAQDDRGGVAEAEIVDLQGRVVQHLGAVQLGPLVRFAWDGRDAHGARVPAGLYLVKVRRGDDVRTSRFILLQ